MGIPRKIIDGLVGSATDPSNSQLGRLPIPAPAPVDQLAVWTFALVCGLFCFVVLPERLKPQINLHLATRDAISYNDFAYGALYMSLGCVVFVVYDVIWRVLCSLLLPVPILVKLRFLELTSGPVDATTTATATTLTGTEALASLPESLNTSAVVRWLAPVRDTVQPLAVDTWFGTYRGVVLLSTLMIFFPLLWATYVLHIRRYFRGTLPEQAVTTVRDPHSGQQRPMPAQMKPKVRVVPMWTYTMVWCLAFAAMFAWVKALPMLLTNVFPALVGLLLVYMIAIP